MPGRAVERGPCARWLALCSLSQSDALSEVKMYWDKPKGCRLPEVNSVLRSYLQTGVKLLEAYMVFNARVSHSWMVVAMAKECIGSDGGGE